MRVEELIVDGFKSYATRTVISHWDPQFNAITGLNGSGKSNILDAICFVLGIASMTTVRASNLQDLIYKRGQAGVTKASVTIVFDNSDRSKSPIGFETNSKISVTRQVTLGGVSKYLINGHRAQQQTVLQLFQSVQLNINNPNFLIMQGKITKVLNMKSKEILSLIEEAAGTKMFEDRRQKAEKVMAKKEIKLQEIKSLLKEEIIPKLDKFRNEKRIFIEYQEIQLQLEEIENIISAFDYHNLTTNFNNTRQIVEDQLQKLAQLKESQEDNKNELEVFQESLDEATSKRQQDAKIKTKDGKMMSVKELSKLESQLNNEISRLKSTVGVKKDDMQDDEAKLNSLVTKIEDLQKYSTQIQESHNIKSKEYNEIKSKLEFLKNDMSLKEELLSSLMTGASSSSKNGEEISKSGYLQQLSSLKNKLNQCNITIKSNEMKITALKNEYEKNNSRLKQALLGHEKSESKLKDFQAEKQIHMKKLESFGYDPNALKELILKESHLKNSVQNFNNQADQWKRRLYSLDFQYSRENLKLSSKDSIKGVAANLFKINESNYEKATALQVCAGGRLFNIVVDNERTASQLLEYGRLKKRVTIIPLNKISARCIKDETVQFAKSLCSNGSDKNQDDVELALNLIEYGNDVAKAMEFIFGSSLICKNAEIAKKVTFHPSVRTKSITLEGDVYDPEGTLSGGSRNNNSMNLLVEVQKYNQCLEQLHLVEEELGDVQVLIKKYQETSYHTKTLQESLNLCDYKIQQIEKEIKNGLVNQLQSRKTEIEGDILNLENDIQLKTQDIVTLNDTISRTENDMVEFNNNKGAKLEQLQKEVADLSDKLNDIENSHETAYDEFQNLTLEKEQIEEEIQDFKNQHQELERNVGAFKSDISGLQETIERKTDEAGDIHETIEKEQQRILQIENEIKKYNSLIKQKTTELKQNEIDHQILQNEHDNFVQNIGSLESHIASLLEKHTWLEDEQVVIGIINQNPDIDLNEYRSRKEILSSKFSAMRGKVNTNIMSMIENVEKKESTLKTMIKTIEKDKKKIADTVEKLNEYKKDTLIKTWEKVSVDFGQIFSELLPNSFAKLVILEDKEITDGLEVKVRLGKIWKESLVELSGGQRSLVALSLILALLQFKPAPMYILDEVDAALDLSHTQNIGHLIKTRFKGSQFIVVSLKEGMFTNANRVFRTRFQDGTSVVNIMN